MASDRWQVRITPPEGYTPANEEDNEIRRAALALGKGVTYQKRYVLKLLQELSTSENVDYEFRQ